MAEHLVHFEVGHASTSQVQSHVQGEGEVGENVMRMKERKKKEQNSIVIKDSEGRSRVFPIPSCLKRMDGSCLLLKAAGD